MGFFSGMIDAMVKSNAREDYKEACKHMKGQMEWRPLTDKELKNIIYNSKSKGVYYALVYLKIWPNRRDELYKLMKDVELFTSNRYASTWKALLSVDPSAGEVFEIAHKVYSDNKGNT